MRQLLLLLTFVVGAHAASPDLALVGAVVFPTPEAVPLRDADPSKDVSAPARAHAALRQGRFLYRSK